MTQPQFKSPDNRTVYNTSLAPSNIRLLGFGDDDLYGRPKCYLIECTTEEARRRGYIALSYYWGDPVFDYSATVNGTSAHITKSVYDMLGQLSQEGSNLYWIDQLCINQMDLDERASQVIMMADIYRNAASVLIWLGPMNVPIAGAFGWLRSRYKPWQALLAETGLSSTKEVQRRYLPYDTTHAAGMTQLFEQEWFFRLWTVQEVALCARLCPIIFRCGMVSLSFREAAAYSVGAGDTELQNALTTTKRAARGFALFQSLIRLALRLDAHIRLTQPGQDPDFAEILCMTARRECLDPRDRIYGLLGLVKSTTVLPEMPSYRMPVDEVYTNFAIHRYNTSRSLRPLERCRQTANRMVNLPSWVPDWTNLPNSLADDQALDAGPILARDTSIYHAGGTGDPQFAIDIDKCTLSAKGIFVDSVKQVWPFLELGGYALATADSANFQPGLCLEALLKAWGPDSPFHQPWDVLWRTLFRDKGFGTGPPSRANDDDADIAARLLSDFMFDGVVDVGYKKRYAQPLATYTSGMVKCRVEEAGHLVELPVAESESFQTSGVNKGRVETEDFKVKEAKYSSALRNFDFGRLRRALVATASHRCGWTVTEAEPGDQIAVLYGYDLPLVVRKAPGEQERYLVIGEAYIHGLMDGEAFHSSRIEDAKDIVFI